ncbi:hypothetical protein C9F11_38865 [Streptomyces sp. YIM 121038]|uniref:hypothetical protein n=1 Tax=Streptomyces sp. YIM 121038 TaxID=2136401 RepID=UPI00111053A7|nr:hypothetical protein [Streptomyces sp. YIM 121038]QCX81356.1 hypothetical protein C9F11_38865 [Streptomyces sp. YIM 121038]
MRNEKEEAHMRMGDSRNPTSIRVSPPPRTGAELKVHPAFERYLQGVRSEVDADLTSDEVEARLRTVLDAHARGRGGARELEAYTSDFGARADWVVYGLQIVQLWLAAIATSGYAGAGPRRDEVDDLVVETVARSVNTFRDQLERPESALPPCTAGTEAKAAFLTECVRHLPHAYRASRLIDIGAPDDAFQDTGEPRLVQRVGAAATAEGGARLRRVGGIEEHDMDEVVALTRRAVRTAVERHPDIVGPGSPS